MSNFGGFGNTNNNPFGGSSGFSSGAPAAGTGQQNTTNPSGFGFGNNNSTNNSSPFGNSNTNNNTSFGSTAVFGSTSVGGGGKGGFGQINTKSSAGTDSTSMGFGSSSSSSPFGMSSSTQQQQQRQSFPSSFSSGSRSAAMGNNATSTIANNNTNSNFNSAFGGNNNSGGFGSSNNNNKSNTGGFFGQGGSSSGVSSPFASSTPGFGNNKTSNNDNAKNTQKSSPFGNNNLQSNNTPSSSAFSSFGNTTENKNDKSTTAASPFFGGMMNDKKSASNSTSKSNNLMFGSSKTTTSFSQTTVGSNANNNNNNQGVSSAFGSSSQFNQGTKNSSSPFGLPSTAKSNDEKKKTKSPFSSSSSAPSIISGSSDKSSPFGTSTGGLNPDASPFKPAGATNTNNSPFGFGSSSVTPMGSESSTQQQQQQNDERLAKLKAELQRKKALLQQRQKNNVQKKAGDSENNTNTNSSTSDSTPLGVETTNNNPFAGSSGNKNVKKYASLTTHAVTPQLSQLPSHLQQRTEEELNAQSQQQQSQLSSTAQDYGDEEEDLTSSDFITNSAVDQNQNISLIGKCDTMCPDDELVQRFKESNIQLLEIPSAGKTHPSHWTLRDTAVKRYQRSAADFKLDIPELVRHPTCLERTLGYLEAWVMERDRQGADPRYPNQPSPSPMDVYQFMWDRTRMIRKDFILQNYTANGTRGGKCNAITVRVHERIARWHAMMEHQLSHVSDFVQLHSGQNIMELGQTMKTLNAYYDDSLRRSTLEDGDGESGNDDKKVLHGCREDFVQGETPKDYDGMLLNNKTISDKRIVGHKSTLNPNSNGTAEPEMRALYILLTLNNDGGMEVLKYVGALSVENPSVYRSKPVQLALDVYKAKKAQNYAKFFSIMRSPSTPYLFACIMFIYVEEMRKIAFQLMSCCFGAKNVQKKIIKYDEYPLKDLVHLLCFEDEDEALAACKHYNITVKMMPSSSSPSGKKAVVLWKHSSYREAKHPEKHTPLRLTPRKMFRTIENKVKSSTRLAICRGDLSGDEATISISTNARSPLKKQTSKITLPSPPKYNTNNDNFGADQMMSQDLQQPNQFMIEQKRLEEEARKQQEELLKIAAAVEAEKKKKREEAALAAAKLAKEREQLEIRKKQEEEERRRQIEEEEKLRQQKLQEEKLRQQRLQKEKEEKEKAEAELKRKQEEEERRRQAAIQAEIIRKKKEEEERLRREKEERERIERMARIREQERLEKIRIEKEKELKRKQEYELKLRREEEERKRRLEKEAEERRIRALRIAAAKEFQRRINRARLRLSWRKWCHQVKGFHFRNEISQRSIQSLDLDYPSGYLNHDGASPSKQKAILSLPRSETSLYERDTIQEKLYYILSEERTKKLDISNILMNSLRTVMEFWGNKHHVAHIIPPSYCDTSNSRHVILCKVAVVVPVYIGENNTDGVHDAILAWIHSKMHFGVVSKKTFIHDDALYELRTVVVDGSTDIDSLEAVDAVLFIIPPFGGSNMRKEGLSFKDDVLQQINASSPSRSALVLDNADKDEESQKYTQELLSLAFNSESSSQSPSTNVTTVPSEHEYRDEISSAISSSLRDLMSSFTNSKLNSDRGFSPFTLQRKTVLQLGGQIIQEVLRRNSQISLLKDMKEGEIKNNDRDNVTQTIKSLLLLLVDELAFVGSELADDSSFAFWPAQEFAVLSDLNMTQAHIPKFFNTSHSGFDESLPLHWLSYLNESDIGEEVSRIFSLEKCSESEDLRTILSNLLTAEDIPEQIRHKCEVMLDKKLFQNCTQTLFLWYDDNEHVLRKDHENSALSSTYIYLPKKIMESVIDRVLKRKFGEDIFLQKGGGTLLDDDVKQMIHRIDDTPETYRDDLLNKKQSVTNNDLKFSGNSSHVNIQQKQQHSNKRSNAHIIDITEDEEDSVRDIADSSKSYTRSYENQNTASKRRKNLFSDELKKSQDFTSTLSALLHGNATCNTKIGDTDLSDILLSTNDIQLPKGWCDDL